MKFYITTAIGYINAPPHIGHALEYVQADVIARYHRLIGNQVFFLTGTDENGSKAYETAKNQRISPQKLADINSKKFSELDEGLAISHDYFIRTSDKKIHWPGVIKLWQKLAEAGDIYKDKYSGFYCVGCEAFLSQKELVDGKCSIHETKPKILSEVNYFFQLSKYQNVIQRLIETDELKIMPKVRKNEILKLISQGLPDVSFSRPASKLTWGIPVPGDPDQIIFVWGDALTNYLTGAGFGRDEKSFQNLWPADLHIIGKDILRFHAIYWPAMLLSAKLPLPKAIFVHGFITFGGKKMSKSLGNIIDPFELIKKNGSDAVRYYLLKEIPPTDDGDITFDKFKNVYNGELANGLGNLVARVATLCEKSGLEFAPPKQTTATAYLFRRNAVGKLLEEFKFNQALNYIWGKNSETDKLINKERPWELLETKSQKPKAESLLQDLVDRVREIASLLSPFLPATSVKIQKQFQGPKIVSEKSLFPRFT